MGSEMGIRDSADTSQKIESRSPRTGEFDSMANESGSGDPRPEGIHPNFMWMLLIGAAGLAAVVVITRLIHMKVDKEGIR